MEKTKIKKKVIVAMSGGVDSSVSAALLKGAGFDVSGVFMKLVDLPNFKTAERRVEKIAKILKVKLIILDLRKEFKKTIIDSFLKEYAAGSTPNPCVLCNKEIKFGLVLKESLKLDTDLFATGHYARIKKDKKWIHLLKGSDKDKDQSYFLWRLDQNQLKRVLFPVGNLKREEVEKMAKELKLPVEQMKKSQEICFLEDIGEFLRKNLKTKPGKTVDVKGNVLGAHQGLPFYTIGQRKGIGLAGGPYFVLKKDSNKHLLIVTKNENNLYEKELITRNVNWLSEKKPELPFRVQVKIRYRHKNVPALIYKKPGNKFKIIFNKPQRAITPGQSVVFYEGQELLGGGIIC
ncbi:MAG: tRNA 2-thiouridine(34) synthase MnmA [Candidatus Nealsonbacteria bacterium]